MTSDDRSARALRRLEAGKSIRPAHLDEERPEPSPDDVVVIPREAAEAALRVLEGFASLRDAYAAVEIRKALS